MKLTNIIYETSGHYVTKTAKGFDIYRMGVTAAVCVSHCGYDGQRGLDWCKHEIGRREGQ